jgi:hypothetical protein
MRKYAIIFLVLISGITFGQKTISNPKVVLDTVYNGTHFIYTWNDGLFITQAVDSTRQMNDSTVIVNHNYFSLTGSNIMITLTKQRIVASGDTIVRRENIQLQFQDIWNAINGVYSNNVLKKQIKKALKDSYKKKTYQE